MWLPNYSHYHKNMLYIWAQTVHNLMGRYAGSGRAKMMSLLPCDWPNMPSDTEIVSELNFIIKNRWCPFVPGQIKYLGSTILYLWRYISMLYVVIWASWRDLGRIWAQEGGKLLFLQPLVEKTEQIWLCSFFDM